jgi:hypothetical protein
MDSNRINSKKRSFALALSGIWNFDSKDEHDFNETAIEEEDQEREERGKRNSFILEPGNM